MKVLVSGSVRVGKSTVSHKLAKKLGLPCFEVTDLIKLNKKIVESVDEFGVKILNLEELESCLSSLDSFIFPSHVSHLLKIVDSKLIILTCDLTKLKARLMDRFYSNLKLEDNLEVERFQSILNEAKELRVPYFLVDNSTSLKNCVGELFNLIV